MHTDHTDSPHQVTPPLRRAFVSSTFSDLREIREEVRTSLRRIGYLDVAMEYLTAEDTRPLEKCLALVRSCDVYVGVFAWRDGYVPPGEQASITELEYLAARDSGLPCVILMLSENAPWPVSKIDAERTRIEGFRRRLEERHIVSTFAGRDDITGRMYEALRTVEDGLGVQGVLAASEKTFREALARARAAQVAQHQSLRMFDLHKDIIIRDIYVQEIVQQKAVKGPYDRLAGARPRSKPIAEAEILSTIRADAGKSSSFTFEGRAGAGKSTMLKMWLLNLLGETPGPAVPGPFPLYVSLRQIEFDGGPWRGALQRAISRTTPALTAEWIDVLLNPDRPHPSTSTPTFLLLLDGLDEMAAPQRRQLLACVPTLPRQQKGVLSSRPGILSEIGYPVGSRCYEICDFQDEQIEAFVARWFQATPELARELLARIMSSHQLRGLASIPLLLTCLAMHVELDQECRLPDDMVENALLRTSVEILAERWDAAREGRAADPVFIDFCMEVFARMTEYPRTHDVPWKDFHAIVRSAAPAGAEPTALVTRLLNNGRVVAGGPDEGVRFSHTIFFDYFFALRIGRSFE